MASRISTKFLPENPTEFCDRLKLLLQEKKAAKNSERIDEETFVTAVNLQEYRSISTKEHKILLVICLN